MATCLMDQSQSDSHSSTSHTAQIHLKAFFLTLVPGLARISSCGLVFMKVVVIAIR